MRDIREKDWFWLDNALVDREDIEAMEKLIYMMLARFCDKDGKCFPSQEKLCKLTGIKDYRTIVKYISKLEEKGLIEVIKSKGKPNVYFLKNVNSEVPAKNVGTKNVGANFVGEVPAKNVGITIHKEQDTIESIKEEQEEDNKTGSDFEIRMLIGTRKIKVWDIKKLNKPIERIRAVFKFAQENNKHEGWIIGALQNDWDLKLYNSNSYKKQEQALYKPASAREVLE